LAGVENLDGCCDCDCDCCDCDRVRDNDSDHDTLDASPAMLARLPAALAHAPRRRSSSSSIAAGNADRGVCPDGLAIGIGATIDGGRSELVIMTLLGRLRLIRKGLKLRFFGGVCSTVALPSPSGLRTCSRLEREGVTGVLGG